MQSLNYNQIYNHGLQPKKLITAPAETKTTQ